MWLRLSLIHAYMLILGNGRLNRLLLMIGLVCLVAPFSAALAQSDSSESAWSGEKTCDIQVNDEEGNFSHFLCRPVPNYFHDNYAAKLAVIRETKRRKEAERSGGAEFVAPGLHDPEFGYRCPDAQGECPTEWIPSPTDPEGNVDVSGLSNPQQYAGSTGFRKGNTYFRRVSGAGIGVQSILDQNPIDAVDVSGGGAYESGEICFQGAGRIIFLDASCMPRSSCQSSLTTSMVGERSCATISRPGTVILLPPEEG